MSFDVFDTFLKKKNTWKTERDQREKASPEKLNLCEINFSEKIHDLAGLNVRSLSNAAAGPLKVFIFTRYVCNNIQS